MCGPCSSTVCSCFKKIVSYQSSNLQPLQSWGRIYHLASFMILPVAQSNLRTSNREKNHTSPNHLDASPRWEFCDAKQLKHIGKFCGAFDSHCGEEESGCVQSLVYRTWFLSELNMLDFGGSQFPDFFDFGSFICHIFCCFSLLTECLLDSPTKLTLFCIFS